MGPVLRRTLIVLAIALGAAAPATAGTIGVRLALQSGALAVAAPTTSVAAGSTVAITVKVADGRGTGKGWTLKFANAHGLSVTGITARCASNSTCTLPTAAGAPTGSTVLQAQHDTGMGIMSLVVTVHSTVATSVAFAVS